MQSEEFAIDVRQFTVNYGKAPVLWDLHFQIPTGGHMVAVIGPNGAGKSTLLKSMLGLIRPITGQVLFFGLPFSKGRKRVAYIPQRGEIDWNFPITALEVVLMGCYGRLKGCWISKKEKERARSVLQKVGMLAFADRQIGQLSGGQQQRIFIARALMQDADLYCMDEPFAGVDAATEQEIFELLMGLKQDGKTLLIVHHDLATVERYFDWTLVLNTCLVGCGPLQEVFHAETIMRAYGRMPTLLHEAARFAERQKSP